VYQVDINKGTRNRSSILSSAKRLFSSSKVPDRPRGPQRLL